MNDEDKEIISDSDNNTPKRLTIKEKTAKIILTIIFIALAVVIVYVVITVVNIPRPLEDPSFSFSESLDGIVITMSCNDNYKYVKFSFELANSDEEIINSQTFATSNCVKGNSVQFVYKPSINEIFSTRYSRCVVIECR